METMEVRFDWFTEGHPIVVESGNKYWVHHTGLTEEEVKKVVQEVRIWLNDPKAPAVLTICLNR